MTFNRILSLVCKQGLYGTLIFKFQASNAISIMHKMATTIFYFMASKRMNHGSIHVIPERDHTQFLKQNADL